MVVGMAGSAGRAPGECQALGKQLSSGGLRVCAGKVEGGQCPTVGLRSQAPGSHTAPLSGAWSEHPALGEALGAGRPRGYFPVTARGDQGPQWAVAEGDRRSSVRNGQKENGRGLAADGAVSGGSGPKRLEAQGPGSWERAVGCGSMDTRGWQRPLVPLSGPSGNAPASCTRGCAGL